jgi:hypothetical protein
VAGHLLGDLQPAPVLRVTGDAGDQILLWTRLAGNGGESSCELKRNIIVRCPMFPETVKVIRIEPMAGSKELVGQGMTSGLVHQLILSPAQFAILEGSPEQ